MIPFETLKQELDELRRDREKLADQAQAHRLLIDLAVEAVKYEEQMAQYQGNRISAPMARLSDALRLLYRTKSND